MNVHDFRHRRDLLVSAGSLLFGSDWQRPIARALGPFHPEGARPSIDDRLVRRWVSGERDIPDWVLPALQRIIASRAGDFGVMAGRLARASAPSESFGARGFFSFEIDEVRHALRNSARCGPWFDFVEDLSRFTLQMLGVHQTPLDDRQRFSISLLFINAFQSFQAGVLLAERAMVTDARAVLRGAAEDAIALIALAADPTFVDRIVAAHYKHQLTWARVFLGDPDIAQHLSAEHVQKLEATVRELEALKGKPGEPKAIIWGDVAQKHCKDLYNLIYRSLSADGTHSTADSMNRHVQADAQMRITTLRIAPDVSDITDIVDAFSTACVILISAIDPFVRMFAQHAHHAPHVKQHLDRYRELEAKDSAAHPRVD